MALRVLVIDDEKTFADMLVMLLGLGRCLGCRHSIIDTPFHMEHTVRHKCGGSNRFDNIRPVCRCYGRKDFLDGTHRLGEVEDLARSTRFSAEHRATTGLC